LNSKYVFFFILIDERQNAASKRGENTKSLLDSRQSMIDWLNHIEKLFIHDDIQITFVPILEDKLQGLKVIFISYKNNFWFFWLINYFIKDIQNDLNDREANIEFLNRNAGDDPASLEFNKTLKSQYEYLNQSLNERITILTNFINELKLFNEDYNRLLNSLNRIDANLQIEHHGSTPFGSVHGKTLEAQLSNLKQVKVDLESLNSSIDALNAQSQKYLFAKNIDLKYSSKLKLDMNTLNDKISQLRIVYTRKLFQLEDALAKSTQVDNQIDDLENWISYKEREILDDEGIIITEDQFDQRTVKYKQLKSELERKEPQIKHIIDTGNDMLKNSSANSSNVTDLAHNMISINTKWTNLIKKVEFKNNFFTEMGELINELRS
jgi:hypothetical protein